MNDCILESSEVEMLFKKTFPQGTFFNYYKLKFHQIYLESNTVKLDKSLKYNILDKQGSLNDTSLYFFDSLE